MTNFRKTMLYTIMSVDGYDSILNDDLRFLTKVKVEEVYYGYGMFKCNAQQTLLIISR